MYFIHASIIINHKIPFVQMNGDHTKEINNRAADEGNESDDEIEPDVHFEPIVNLPLVDVSNNEEGEEELIKLWVINLLRYFIR